MFQPVFGLTISTLWYFPWHLIHGWAICRGAWNQRQEWADYSYELILQGTQGIDVLQNICEDMKSSIEAINAQHQKIQAFLDHMSRIDDRADGQSDESNE